MHLLCSVNIKTVGLDRFEVWALNGNTATAVLRNGTKLDVDRQALGLSFKKSYKPPQGNPGTFTRQEAITVAHQIGRYYLNLGDLVYSYTTIDGKLNPGFFEG